MEKMTQQYWGRLQHQRLQEKRVTAFLGIKSKPRSTPRLKKIDTTPIADSANMDLPPTIIHHEETLEIPIEIPIDKIVPLAEAFKPYTNRELKSDEKRYSDATSDQVIARENVTVAQVRQDEARAQNRFNEMAARRTKHASEFTSLNIKEEDLTDHERSIRSSEIRKLNSDINEASSMLKTAKEKREVVEKLPEARRARIEQIRKEVNEKIALELVPINEKIDTYTKEQGRINEEIDDLAARQDELVQKIILTTVQRKETSSRSVTDITSRLLKGQQVQAEALREKAKEKKSVLHNNKVRLAESIRKKEEWQFELRRFGIEKTTESKPIEAVIPKAEPVVEPIPVNASEIPKETGALTGERIESPKTTELPREQPATTARSGTRVDTMAKHSEEEKKAQKDAADLEAKAAREYRESPRAYADQWTEKFGKEFPIDKEQFTTMMATLSTDGKPTKSQIIAGMKVYLYQKELNRRPRNWFSRTLLKWRINSRVNKVRNTL